eukprot:CAMPEP_0176142766 /NCGR_PEP_ID=MMETSP0120_2-20121206/72648_1 /TAXON_ID=160619 /ORGANISM="Kryptoperidinium foliaceum, Strain CCMP 1326" /LENGTH=39 /DNA_ID= /DNA_START= /DNA_END= /DNA_ORIENTATION=
MAEPMRKIPRAGYRPSDSTQPSFNSIIVRLIGDHVPFAA